jgi:DNA mismatch endonuclease (patch repair protein)
MLTRSRFPCPESLHVERQYLPRQKSAQASIGSTRASLRWPYNRTMARMGAKGSWASSPGRRRNMQAIRARDTEPELAVRKILHARGLRYRVGLAPIPNLRRTADIVFTKARIAVFIDGCFWHGCPEHGRKKFNSNVDYWNEKISKNVVRDANTNSRLASAGWVVLRFWEHEDAALVADSVIAAVQPQ